MRKIVLPGLILAGLATEGRIIIRHDRPDARYLALGERHEAVVKVGRRMGDGTLIGARWVLTAAHVADGLMRRKEEPVVYHGAQGHRVVRAFLHPNWVEMGPTDIALLELASPVSGVDTINPYQWRDEDGKVAVLVGHGRTGKGSSRERTDDDRRRGATNRIERTTSQHLVFRFDAPPAGTDLEGIPGAGDSGGPALLERAGRWHVAGVSHAGEPGVLGPGTYGALDYFVRVSSYLSWIREVRAGRVSANEFTSMSNEETRGGRSVVIDGVGRGQQDPAIPDSPAGRRLRALLSFLQSGDSSQTDAFIRANVRGATGPVAPAEERARYNRLLTDYGKATVLAVLMQAPHQVDVAVQTSTGERILGVQVESGENGRITGVLVGRP